MSEQKRSKRLSKIERAEAQALWETGHVTLQQLSEKFGVTPESLSRFFTKNGIVKGSKSEEIAAEIQEKVKKDVLGETEVLSVRIKETKEEHYRMSMGYAKLAWAEFLKAKQDGVPFASLIPSLKALELGMRIAKMSREDRFSILGLDKADAVDENELPSLEISTLTDEEQQKLRGRNKTSLREIDQQIEQLAEDTPDPDIIQTDE